MEFLGTRNLGKFLPEIFWKFVEPDLYIQGVPKRIAQSSCTTILQPRVTRVLRFSAKCSERNCLHDKGQCLNTAIKCSLFCSWQVKYLITKLTEKSLRQICGVNKVPAKPTFQN